MSVYSTSVKNILDNTLVPQTKRLMSSIALIEPYTIDSEDLQDRYHELSRLTSIYDYLHEYAIGNEETSNSDLVQIIRLVGNMSINLQPEVYNVAYNNQTQTKLFTIYVDNLPYTDGDLISVGLHDFRVEFSGECAVTKLIYKQKMVGAPGTVVHMQNVSVDDPGGCLEFKVYGNNGILLTSAMTCFETGGEL